MCVPEPSIPRWPARLKELCQALQTPLDDASREATRGEVWLLLHASIARYLRWHAQRIGAISHEEMQDIAAQKSLDLMRGIESGENEMRDRLPAEIAGYLARVARNGLLDQLRLTNRQVAADEADPPAWDLAGLGARTMGSAAPPPDLLVERREFAAALRHCAGELAPRSRTVWLLRVICEMPSREIASHPEVNSNAGHVDVLLQRSREAMRVCMQRRGHDPEDMPPGALLELWHDLQLAESSPRAAR